MQESSRERWNKRADRYARRGIMSKDDEYVVNMLNVYEGDLKKADVLDIGCGPGIWSLSLVGDVKSITGLDISDKMIGHANAKKDEIKAGNARFHVGDWAKMEPGKGPLSKKYDIVIMRMTPAIGTIADLQKAIDVCKGYCFYTSRYSRSHPLRDVLDAKSGISRYEGHLGFFFEVMRHVAESGMKPYVSYDSRATDHDYTIEECVADFQDNYPELGREGVEEIVRCMANGNRVSFRSEMTRITAHWSVPR
ncbi:MAG: class I SAM-dependent methyltransferase [Thermoplasmatales archaeon]|nr:class I SAM-dependent methyltransferase [Thermoplasmatales archaeon]